MAKKTIREVARETSIELGQAFNQSREFLKKRVRTPPRTSGRPSLAFALIPQEMRVARPKPIMRKKRR